MTYQEALEILKNPNDYTTQELNEAFRVLKTKMFGR